MPPTGHRWPPLIRHDHSPSRTGQWQLSCACIACAGSHSTWQLSGGLQINQKVFSATITIYHSWTSRVPLPLCGRGCPMLCSMVLSIPGFYSCSRFNVSPSKSMSKSQPLGLVNMTLLVNNAFADGIKWSILRWDHPGFGVGLKSNDKCPANRKRRDIWDTQK